MKETSGEFFRYAAIGLAANLLVYFGYLFLTAIGLKPVFAMTGLYIGSAIFSYLLNSRLTFRKSKKNPNSLYRFSIAHASGYAINFILLNYFGNVKGHPHQVVQLFSIAVVAVYLFFVSKFFVFNDART